MLTSLSIRNVVFIERLDMTLGAGLTAFTGETGAGKSIVLDSLGLVLGARGDAALVRRSAEKATVAASFDLAPDHAVFNLLAKHEIETEGELILRRHQSRDGRGRATLNDQPVSITLLRKLGAVLGEIHGQHDDRALIDMSRHRRLLDIYGGLDRECETVARAWSLWRAAQARQVAHDEKRRHALAERTFLEHSVNELDALSPGEGEEEDLAERRRMMMNAEQFTSALSQAARALGGGDDASGGLGGALRRLERLQMQAGGRLDEVVSALDRVLVEMGEAEDAIAGAGRDMRFDQTELDRVEERLFALRAAARKHKVKVCDLPALLERFRRELGGLEESEETAGRLDEEGATLRKRYFDRAQALSAKRKAVAAGLGEAVMAELPPLKLERARFEAVVNADENHAGPRGIDRVEFHVATNPGTPPAPLIKVASGGELARLMLALKVVLAARGGAPLLIFDEIDTGVGGAAADAIGVRLARLADKLQVLAVTHSPQVAARAHTHMRVAKETRGGEDGTGTLTWVESLDPHQRREEIARMLSAASITEEARAQAERLLDGGN
ncbi:MAG: DNA repair protein RecN [Hyphomicrobiales bacterium]